MDDALPPVRPSGRRPGRWSRVQGRGAYRLLAVIVAACGTDPAAPVDEVPLPPPPAYAVAEQLPTLELHTASRLPITSKVDYVQGTFRLLDSAGTALLSGALEVRGRGTSTWAMPKKPYRVKLAAGASLLGMPASRHWVLLANYADKTLLRNDVAFELSRRLGMAWTPRARFVDLVLNGAYEGVYQLVEHVRIAPERVAIDELKVTDTSATAITGGYLLEVDERASEAFCPRSARTGMVFCAQSPETLAEPAWARQAAWITSYLQQVDEAILGPQFTDPVRGYAAVLDVESAIAYYLVQEVVKNVDGNLRLSTYLYKPRGGKLTFGPVWDFDLALGNVNYDGADNPEGWHIRTAAWYRRLFQDPAFVARVNARWAQLRADRTLDALSAYVSQRKAYLGTVQVRNFQRWPILGTWVWPNRVVTGSYDGEVMAMLDWLFLRRRWMEAQFPP